MEHPSFSEAGGVPGIEIWTIDKFEPVAIDSKLYGKFYNGDSYIVLKTSGSDQSSLFYDAHFWIGEKTTQDKKGSAAILTITLDDMLGGKAVHHREVQGYESSLFLGYFKPAIRYLEGGNESGFNQVVTNAGAEKRLLKLTGTENMRIKEVPAETSSLTKEHCFILEVEHDIFVLMPEGARATQRRKIISVANRLRDDEHNGRATIEIIDEFSSDDDVALFFEALGSGSMDEIKSDDSSSTYSYQRENISAVYLYKVTPGDELELEELNKPFKQTKLSSESYQRENISAVYLYKVTPGDELELEELNKPFKQTKLSSEDIFILDTPCSGVYVWIGSDVSSDVKKTYSEIADKYLEIKSYPTWVNVTKVSEGSESSNFKQYFHNWDSTGAYRSKALTESDAGYYSEDQEHATTAAKLIGKSAAARGYMPDHGDGKFNITRLSNGNEDVTDQFSEDLSVLYQNEVYLVKYEYTNSEGADAAVVYCWIGSDASEEDRATAFDKAYELENEIEGNVALVKVPQGKEPKHFLSIFKGNLAIVFGGTDTENKPTNKNGSYEEDNTRLFRVEGTELGVDMRASQVPETADSLEDDDVFVLETKDRIYLWSGKESAEDEQEAAKKFVKAIVGEEKEVTEVAQGEEPDEFWEALGGKVEEKEDASGWKQTVNRRVTTPRTLSSATVTVSGKIKFEDLDTEYTQQDLSEDGVFILDTGEELYLWQGKNIPERYKAARTDIVKEYIEDDGLERTFDTSLVVFVRQGEEPSVFKKLFPEWDNDLWENLTSYDDMKSETKAANSK